ncbi:MAG: hypothetical protein GY712_05725 [Oceanicoccus sp.]|uniref:hypothetical protein n=1 Tax=Oceanicoccus sp. TaxID=2691044 RepID=UPI0026311310|nr:hypothetical protein [Oceanicoccus sp.]MCP3907499.1 hypothetical protein [Oceanicoccus sp.]MDG1771813.1 hypothetical protein [Oceanicoccus sp.]
MKALASMAVKFKRKSSNGRSVEGAAPWSDAPLVLIKSRPESQQHKKQNKIVLENLQEDCKHFVLGYN